MSTRLTTLVLAALLLACNNPRPGTLWYGSVGEPDLPEADELCVDPTLTETFVVADFSGVDVLLIVDDSASMKEEQGNLARNFQAFIAQAPEGVNYQIGVTTTSLNNSGLLHGYPPVVDPASASEFLDNAEVGTLGSNTEQGLAAARMALEGSFQPYLRQGALLVLIFVSDEDDQSSGHLANYESTFLAFKGGHREMLRTFAIVGGPEGCSNDDGKADPSPRYLDVVRALDGEWSSICDESFGESLQAFGQGTFTPRTAYPLDHEPVADTLVVRVNGSNPSGGWYYDGIDMTVHLYETPVPGDVVTVRYERGDCL